MLVSKCCDKPVADADRPLDQEFSVVEPKSDDGIVFYECPCGCIWNYDDLFDEGISINCIDLPDGLTHR